MLLFIAIIATLNLCLGYVLGVYFGECPLIRPRRVSRPSAPVAYEDDWEEDEDGVPEEVEEPVAESEAPKTPSADELKQGIEAFKKQLAEAAAAAPVEEPDSEVSDTEASAVKSATPNEQASEGQGLDGSAGEDPAAREEDTGEEGSLATLDSLIALVEAALAEDEVEHPTILAAVRLDPIESEFGGDAEAMGKGILTKLAKLSAEITGSEEYVAVREHGSSGSEIVLTMGRRSTEEATKAVDRFRQQVEKMTFSRDGAKVQTTATCALVQAPEDSATGDLLTWVDEALAEASESGGNCLYTHDGAFAAPVAATDAKGVAAKTVVV